MSRRKTKTKSTNDVHNTSISPCIICLDEVRCRGQITVCDHWFCFPCILEWSKNTNTCPVCKARFRTISKVHLSPQKSPTTKIRVPDKDQRVWNDDDDIAFQDLIDNLQNDLREEMDSDYVPPAHLQSSFTRTQLSIRFQQQELDDYDLEDSFIDDSNLTQLSFEECFYLDGETDSVASSLDDLSDDFLGIDFDFDSEHDFEGSEDDDDYWEDDDRDNDSINDRCTDKDFHPTSSLYRRPQSSRVARSTPSSRSRLTRASRTTSRSQFTRALRASKITARSQPRQASRTSNTQRPQASHNSEPSHSSLMSTKSSSDRKIKSKETTKNYAAKEKRLNSKRQKQERQENDMIVHSIQETGSSGWLTTSRRANRAAAVTALRQIKQSANEQLSPDTSRRRSGLQRASYHSINNQVTYVDSSDDDVQITSMNNIDRKGLSSRATRGGSQAVSYAYDIDMDEQLATEGRRTLSDTQHQIDNISPRGRPLHPTDNKTNKGKGKRKKGSWKGKENKFMAKNNIQENDAARKRFKLQQKTLDDYENVKTTAKQDFKSVVFRKTSVQKPYYDNFEPGPSTSVEYCESDYNNSIGVYSEHQNRHNSECVVVDKHVLVDTETDDESTIVLPTPQDRKKRSLFTRRQHKPMLKGFDDDSDSEKRQGVPQRVMCSTQGCSKDNKIRIKQGKIRRRIKVYDSESD